MHQHFLFLCFLVPHYILTEKELLCLSFGPLTVKSLDSLLMPFFLLKYVGNLEEKGVGRVTKYCINYDCWNEQLDNRENSVPPRLGRQHLSNEVARPCS